MTGKKRRLSASLLALFLFAVSFVQFFHTESSLRESPNCPACQANQAGLGILSVHQGLVFHQVFIAVIFPLDEPLRLAERRDGNESRSPPLS